MKISLSFNSLNYDLKFIFKKTQQQVHWILKVFLTKRCFGQIRLIISECATLRWGRTLVYVGFFSNELDNSLAKAGATLLFQYALSIGPSLRRIL